MIIGADETGLGAWAGPAFVGAVLASEEWTHPELKDSKSFSSKKKLYRLADELREDSNIAFSVVEVSVASIDTMGIFQATMDAFTLAIFELRTRARAQVSAILDGSHVPYRLTKAVAKHGADSSVATVMAAAIIAKAHRDSVMKALAETYPGYGWETNAGYGGAKAHRDGLEKFGVTPVHRKSYKPIRKILGLPPKDKTKVPKAGRHPVSQGLYAKWQPKVVPPDGHPF